MNPAPPVTRIVRMSMLRERVRDHTRKSDLPGGWNDAERAYPRGVEDRVRWPLRRRRELGGCDRLDLLARDGPMAARSVDDCRREAVPCRRAIAAIVVCASEVRQ